MSRPPSGRPLPGNRWDLLDGVVPAEPPTVTVVVTHYEQPDELARTLAALRRQTHPADRLQVVVSDDGSTVAPRVPPGTRLVRQEDRGFRAAAARNLGASVATGEVLCFLDADTSPEPEYVERLTRLPALAPETVAVGLRRHADLATVAPDEPVEVAGPRHRLAPPGWLEDAYRRSRDLLDADDRSYRFVISSVLACSRWFFTEVGGFAESFTTYGGEDWEWADRAWRSGAVLAHVRDAVAWHDGPDWAGRTGTDRAVEKNHETGRLLDRALPGLTPQALRLGPPAVVATVRTAPSPEALLVGVDQLLVALPGAEVRVPPEHAALLAADPRVVPADARAPGPPRVRVEVAKPVRLDPGVLAAAVARVSDEQLRSLRLLDAAGTPVVTVGLDRAETRSRRWDRHDLFTVAEAVVEVTDVPAVPDLEGYLGGWA